MRPQALFALCLAVVLGLASAGRAAAATAPARAHLDPLSNAVTPLYPVSGGGLTTAVGYRLQGGTLSAIDQNGLPVWSRAAPSGATGLWGTFDFDQDGWPDPGVVTAVPTGGNCDAAGSPPITTGDLELYRGRNGEAAAPPASAESSCQYDIAPYAPVAYARWSWDAPLFGTGPELALPPVYKTQGFFTRYSSGSWRSHNGQPGADAFLYPNGSWWDYYYAIPGSPNNPADQGGYTVPSSEGHSHVFNGLITQVQGEPRMIAWTTRRLVNFRINAAFPSQRQMNICCVGYFQLVRDLKYCPYCSISYQGTNYQNAGETGRNYGLTARDPASSKVILLAGTDVLDVFTDMDGAPSDPYGQITRHFSIYDPVNSPGTIADRPFSYAHVSPNAPSGSPTCWGCSNYFGRLVYPANPFVATGSGASRIAYNVYRENLSDARWKLHISHPGSTGDLFALNDVFLWDIRDVDGDGVDEWVISPTVTPGDRYLPQKKIVLYTWNESTDSLVHERTIDGVYPYIRSTFRQPTVSSSRGALYPVLSTQTPTGLKLVVTNNGTTAQPAN